MSRYATQPSSYASLGDLHKALLTQMRRYNRACRELAGPAKVMTLTPTGTRPSKPIKVTRRDNQDLDKHELLRAQIILLGNMEGQLRNQFGNNPKARAILKQVQDLKRDIDAGQQQAFKNITDEGRLRVNTEIVRAANAAARELISELKLKPESVETKFIVADIMPKGATEPVANAEVSYIRLTGLKDGSGYEYPQMWVVIAYPAGYKPGIHGDYMGDTRTKKVLMENPMLRPHSGIGPAPGKEVKTTVQGKRHIYVAVTPDFRIPRQMRWDAAVTTPKEIRSVVRELLAQGNVIGTTTEREVPIPHDKVAFSHSAVLNTTVRGNTIEVRIKDPAKAESIRDALHAELLTLIRNINPKNHDVIRSRIERDKGGAVIRFVFTLPGNLRGRIIPNDMWIKIKRELNLSELDLKRIKTALEDHEG
jgi:hypothetical protein